MTVTPNRFILPTSQFHIATGPAVGYFLKFYQSGTSTPQNVYTDVAMTSPTNNVELNELGMPDVDIFLHPDLNYRLVITDPSGTPILTYDNVDDPARNAIANFTVTNGNPNGNTAGNAGIVGASPADVVFDLTNNILWVCTTTGTTSTAVWTNVSANIAGSVNFSSMLTPGTFSTDQSNYNPTGMDTASSMRINPGANCSLTGLGGGSAGRLMLIHNISATFILSLNNESVSSSAANRFILPGSLDQQLRPNTCALMQYDAVTARWRLVAGPIKLADGGAQYMSNVGFAVSVAGNALTIALKTAAGTDPTTTDPCVIGFRSTTANSGDFDLVTVTTALSLVISNGSTLGFLTSETNLIHVGFINNSGTVELAASKDGGVWVTDRTINTAVEGGVGSADISTTIYSTVARSTVACRLAATILITTGATPGQWGIAPTRVSLVSYVPYQPFANTVKARNTYTETTTTAILDCFNISSVTDVGVGDTQSTFAVAMPKNNYSVGLTGQRSHNGGGLWPHARGLASLTTAYLAATFESQTKNEGGGFDDALVFSIIVSSI